MELIVMRDRNSRKIVPSISYRADQDEIVYEGRCAKGRHIVRGT